MNKDRDEDINHRKRGTGEPLHSGADGGGDGSAFPPFVQGDGGGPALYGDGQCKGSFIWQ